MIAQIVSVDDFRHMQQAVLGGCALRAHREFMKVARSVANDETFAKFQLQEKEIIDMLKEQGLTEEVADLPEVVLRYEQQHKTFMEKYSLTKES